jgi:DNA-binding NtrC family response regulator
MPTVLIVDDNASVVLALRTLLALHDIHSLSCDSPAAALERLAREDIDLVIQDMNFQADTTSGAEGVALFQALRAQQPDLPVILMTAWTHLESAVQLVRAGAADYLAKPWDDRKLLATVQNLLELGAANRRLAHEARRRQRSVAALQERFDLRGFIFADAATEAVLALACQVARAPVPVLITGPNGAGKEKVAEIIQANSAVRGGPFVAVNCGALPAELIEAELFGAEAGAYTGAQRARAGRFEAADGGTLFLDEIGNLPPSGQMKLLRVLETGRYTRLGGQTEQQVSVRVVSATNADLPALMAQGLFRQDLYYRLNLIEISLPPLAERRDDILPLARHFLGSGHRLQPAAEAALLRHPWPGNVRELKNTMQRVALLHPGGEVQAADLGLPAAPGAPAAAHAAQTSQTAPGGAATEPATRRDDEPDRQTVLDTLARCDGVVAQAAQALGLSRQALYRRLERWGVPRQGGSAGLAPATPARPGTPGEREP